MKELILLMTIHCVADYPLQGEFLANIKAKNFFLLIVHAFIWAGLVYAGLVYFYGASEWWFLFLLIGHVAIDNWKCRRTDKTKALTTDLYIDQFLHFVQIVTVWWLA